MNAYGPDENVSKRLPVTDVEVDILKPAIVELLRVVPDRWATFEFDALTVTQTRALFLLTAAGFIERRGWVRATMLNHPTQFEFRFEATGEGGFAKAMERMAAIQFELWGDAWRAWCNSDKRTRSPFQSEEMGPNEWRLTDEGVLARSDVTGENRDGSPELVFEYVLKRGFFGPGYWFRKLSTGHLTESEHRVMDRLAAAGHDLARITRPPVSGEGCVLETRKLEQTVSSQSVHVANWNEGASAIASEVDRTLGRRFDALAAQSRDNTGSSPAPTGTPPTEPTQQSGEARDTGPAGFIGATELAVALGVHETRRSAFIRRLERDRRRLGEGNWHEVQEPRRNSPRFLYRMDALEVRSLAEAYVRPKTK